MDFVNLRTEKYTSESRIPHVNIGTPEEVRNYLPLFIFAAFIHHCSVLFLRHSRSCNILVQLSLYIKDAHRRDITINSLFYNIGAKW